jgi:hypothetical protein
MKTRIVLVLGGMFVCIVIPIAGLADCGSIPFSSPLHIRSISDINSDGSLTGTELKFDPLAVVVYEPGQRGIILWNGTEQILLHSTDIRTSQASALLEVMPFPSEPTVTLGDFEAFEKMQRLLIDKSMWRVASGGGVPGVRAPEDAAEITFFESMGTHEVTVVKVNDPANFTAWVMNFLAEQQAFNPKLDPRFVEIINNYLDRGMHWFIFDTVYADDELQSKEPLLIRFKTPQVYYPLEISTLETGKTTVDLLIVTRSPISTYGDLKFAVKRDSGVTVTQAELNNVSEEWAQFMNQPELTMQRVYIRGKLSGMKTDFTVR